MASRGRPKKLPDDTSVVMLRCPDWLIGELDRWVAELREENIGMSGITRSDLIRNVLMRAVEDRQKRASEHVASKPRKKR